MEKENMFPIVHDQFSDNKNFFLLSIPLSVYFTSLLP